MISIHILRACNLRIVLDQLSSNEWDASDMTSAAAAAGRPQHALHVSTPAAAVSLLRHPLQAPAAFCRHVADPWLS